MSGPPRPCICDRRGYHSSVEFTTTLMIRKPSVVLPFPHHRSRCEARLPLFASRPIERDGLVFGVGAIMDRPGEVAITNVSGLRRVWEPGDRPWGRMSEGASWLAGEVVIALRPDWRESFWSFEFLASVTRDFAETFLVCAPFSGGVIGIQEIRGWMERMQIGRPAWDYACSTAANPTDALANRTSRGA